MIKISILGSTGSIGSTTLNIIKKNKKNFQIVFLSANSNIRTLFKQSKELNVKNVIIPNQKLNNKWKNTFKKNQIKIYHNFNSFDKIIKRKLDYVINGISGLDGLDPTLKIIKYTKNLAIANKESIICGWNLINKLLLKNKTNFIPVDSEHFSIYQLIKNHKKKNLKKIILTASGGPFLKRKNLKKIKLQDALKHPNWTMGKKITIDSSTLMNKVFEVIEAKKIFNLDLKKIDILINPNSYVHAIVIFNNGTIKFLAHETRMDIPIFNSIYQLNNNAFYKTKNIDLNKINNLNLSQPNIKHFKTLNILKLIPSKDSLFETVLISVNDELVRMFLNNEIKYEKLLYYLLKIIKFPNFKKYCKVRPNSIKDILKTNKLAKNFVKNYVKYKKY